MKALTHHKQMVRHACIFVALLVGMFLAPAARAQSARPKMDNRFLFIFDTASNMKRCLPGVQKALNEILAADTNGLLSPGDSLGVWTFDQQLHAGQFPLQRWQSDNAAMITASIAAFIGKQNYTKTTRFDAFLPSLNQLVSGSKRLTVLIFCDGQGEIQGTPYDVGINRVFKERQKERQKARQPIVIGLRSQHGQYAGCIISFPPQPVSLPDFPPLPEAVAPPKVTNAPALPGSLRPGGQPLIIVGTTITNRVPPPAPKPPPMPKPVLTNPPPMVATSAPEPVITNEVKPPEEVLLMQTGTIPARPKIAAAPSVTTNANAQPPAISRTGHRGAWTVTAAFLVVVAGLVFSRFRRAPKPGSDNSGGSSMKKN